MIKYKTYHSPIGDLVLTSEDNKLTGLFFKDKITLKEYKETENLKIFSDTFKWLDMYFSKQIPNFELDISFKNSTDFQKSVLLELLKIPYGKTITYGDISKKLEEKYKIKKMSSQAVGQAVKRNPIAIIIPCHRVIGKDNKITGYYGGLEKKYYLLNLEGIDTKNLK